MPGFIECLLQNHKDTLKEALKLHEKACRNAEKTAGRNAGWLGGDDIAPQIDELIQEELMHVNLMDPQIYDALQKNAEDWYVPYESDVGAQVKCVPIQQAVLADLEECRDRQLQEAEERCKRLDLACNGFVTVLDDMITCEEYDAMEKHFAEGGDMNYTPGTNQKIDIAMKQREAVIELHRILMDEKVPFYKRVENFTDKYRTSRSVIATGKDEHTNAFLKFIDKIVNFVKEHIFTSLWEKSGGGKLTKAVDELLHPSNKTGKP